MCQNCTRLICSIIGEKTYIPEWVTEWKFKRDEKKSCLCMRVCFIIDASPLRIWGLRTQSDPLKKRSDPDPVWTYRLKVTFCYIIIIISYVYTIITISLIAYTSYKYILRFYSKKKVKIEFYNCMFKKSCPLLFCGLLYTNRQDLLYTNGRSDLGTVGSTPPWSATLISTH